MLSDGDVRPEPNAAVRIMRLAQLTSGYWGQVIEGENPELMENQGEDISSEKLAWLVSSKSSTANSRTNALSSFGALAKRAREVSGKIVEYQYSNLSYLWRAVAKHARRAYSANFMAARSCAIVLLAQPHAGGFGLTLTAASTAVYLSNDFSLILTRVQAEDRQSSLSASIIRDRLTYWQLSHVSISTARSFADWREDNRSSRFRLLTREEVSRRPYVRSVEDGARVKAFDKEKMTIVSQYIAEALRGFATDADEAMMIRAVLKAWVQKIEEGDTVCLNILAGRES